MKLSRFIQTVLFVLIGAFFLQSCGGEDPFSIDYSQVPPPFNPSEAIRDTVLAKGVKIYIIEEGDGLFHVTFKDQIVVKYTGRTQEGEIFYSTYAIRFEADTTRTSTTLSNLYPYPIRTQFGPVSPLIEGFRKGLYGMEPGEKRIIVVPPEMGSSRQTRNGINLEGKVLIFNVELINILGVPRDKM